MNWLNEQFSLFGEFLKGGFRRTAVFCALGMAGAAVLGAVTGLLFPQQAAQVLNIFMEQIEQSGVIAVTYTPLPSPRDRTRYRMPSTA